MKKHVFFRWFMSYLFLLGLVLLSSIAIYFYSYQQIKSQQMRTNAVLLEKVRSEVDIYFQTAANSALSLLLDPNAEKAIARSREFSIADQELLHTLFHSIRSRLQVETQFKHFFIWFFDGDTVLSENGHMDKRLFHSLYYSGEDYASFDGLLKNGSGQHLVIQKDARGEEDILFILNRLRRGPYASEATVAVSFSGQWLRERMENLKWNPDSEFLLFYDTGVLCGTDNLREMLDSQAVDLSVLLRTKQILLGGENRYVEILPSANGYYIASFTSSTSIAREAGKIQTFTLFILLLSITVGSLAAYLLARINYIPFRRALSKFGEYNGDGAETKNEYEWFEAQADRFIREHREVKKKFYENTRMLQNQYLYRLITLPYDVGRSMDFDKKEDFLDTANMIVLLYIEELEEPALDTELDRGLLRFVLNNVLEEQAKETFGSVVVDLVDSYACLVHGDSSLLQKKDEVEEIFYETAQFIQKNMGIRMLAVFGPWQMGIEGIYTSYLLAREASEYREHNQGQAIWYEDIKNRHTLYHYPMEIEQKIIHAIRLAHEEDAIKWVREVLAQNFRERELPQTMKRCLFSDILGTIIKGAEQSGGAQPALSYLEEQDMPRSYTEEALGAYFAGLIHTLTKGIERVERQKKENTQFGLRVMEYVKENYQNPDLNISITALHFGITPSYLSSLFKEQSGCSLLEFINRTRIERAKELLEQGHTLSEVCTLSGFRNSGALIRVFKKNTGLTPGQMRKLFEN